MSENGGIEGIVFGEDAEGFGELTNLAWIDDDDREGGSGEFGGDETFVAAGSFEDNEAWSAREQLLNEDAEALRVVGEGQARGGTVLSEIEFVFGDIDADERSGTGHA